MRIRFEGANRDSGACEGRLLVASAIPIVADTPVPFSLLPVFILFIVCSMEGGFQACIYRLPLMRARFGKTGGIPK